MSGLVLDEDAALELLAYLVTAARTQVDEAAEYAPLRLLTAARRLGAAIAERASPDTARFVAGPLAAMPELAVPRAERDVLTGLHALGGFDQNGALINSWSLIVDLVQVAIVLWVLSGVVMWWETSHAPAVGARHNRGRHPTFSCFCDATVTIINVAPR